MRREVRWEVWKTKRELTKDWGVWSGLKGMIKGGDRDIVTAKSSG